MDKQENFVFKEIKSYCHNEWLAGGVKRYRRVYEAQNTDYISAEISLYNKMFDRGEWELVMNIKALDEKGKILCDQEHKELVTKDKNIITIRKGWGMPTPGGFWKRGAYRWEAWSSNNLLATYYFYVEDSGIVTEESNPYFELGNVLLFNGPGKLIPKDQRSYAESFSSKDTRYVWFELEIVNKITDFPYWACEFIFQIRNEINELKAVIATLDFIKKEDNVFLIEEGWGNENPGSWFRGIYYLDLIFMDKLIRTIPFKIFGEEGNAESSKPESKHPAKTEKTAHEILQEINEMIGLEPIKKRIKEYYGYLQFINKRKEAGITETDRVGLHSVFMGNPGTGKTKIANLLGKIYKDLGLLTSGHVHEVDRADLIGEFIGHTAPKVKAAIAKARGGILFIDEAYSLAREGASERDFGQEAIEILIKEMSDGDGNLAIIVAGYPNEMRHFLDSNPGLKSRFNMYFDFPDYNQNELMQIADYSASKRNLVFSEDARKYLYKQLVEAYRNRDRTFGNARYVNSIVEEAKMNLGTRIMSEKNPGSATKEDLMTIKLEDVEKVFERERGDVPELPLDENLLRESLAKLNNLVGLQNIKTEIHETVKLVKFYKEIGKNVRNTFSVHSVFTGNPGTGKTTVARIVSEIYKALGILEKGHLVECDREALVGAYVGQTAIKTSEMIEKARGGVLFIDEAYSLVQNSSNDFGNEAIQILLKRMEDMRGELGVICAGYTENMEEFLKSNPGLRSRFDKILKFPDYTEEELFQIALYLLKENEIAPDEESAAHLKAYLTMLRKGADKYFGNARDVRRIIAEAIKNQHLRLSEVPKSKRTKQMMSTLTLDDVSEFKLDEIKSKKKFGFVVE